MPHPPGRLPQLVTLKAFTNKNLYNLAEDATGAPAYLAPNDWHLTHSRKGWKGVTFARIRENR